MIQGSPLYLQKFYLPFLPLLGTRNGCCARCRVYNSSIRGKGFGFVEGARNGEGDFLDVVGYWMNF